MLPLAIDQSRRYLQMSDGTPFHWIGDTAWELFHKLNCEEAIWYLTERAKQGFTVIQAVILAECDGLHTPNAYGRLPLRMDTNGLPDPTKPDCTGKYSYFDHVETILCAAESRGLYMAVLPTWGDKWNRKWGVGPEIFTPENAFQYGKWLAARLCHHDNLIWLLGGDRPIETPGQRTVINAMADGLRAGDGGKFLIGFHPSGAASSIAARSFSFFFPYRLLCRSANSTARYFF